MKYYQRLIESSVLRLSGQFPVILLTGARQSGKTTVLRHLSGPERTYLSLDDPTLLHLAADDPGLLLQRFDGDLLIDEIQRAPELLLSLKLHVDRAQGRGRYWLTGSQGFEVMKGVSESLAGRVAILDLLPFSLAERRQVDLPRLAWYPGLDIVPGRQFPVNLRQVFEAILDGGFPRLVSEPETDRANFLASYIRSYLERDVRDLLRVGDLRDFDRFLRSCAARTAQMVNMSEIARDVGVSVPTVKQWLSVLEASGQVFLLEPYYRNIGKRLVKSPKLYFLNTGLACYLTGWRSVDTASAGAMAGALFETFVIGEVLKSWTATAQRPPIYYWRTKDKTEIDLIFEIDGVLYPVEIKLSAAPKLPTRAWQGLSLAGMRVGRGAVVCLAERFLPLSDSVDTVPVGML